MAAASQHHRLKVFVAPCESDSSNARALEAWIEQLLRDGGNAMALRGYDHEAVPARLL
jgi:hypothetical protein